MTVITDILALTNAPTVEELWDRYTRKMCEYGFDRILYGCTHSRTDTSLGDPDDFMFLARHDAEYVDYFLTQGMYVHTPMMAWVLENSGASSWGILQERTGPNCFTEMEREVLKKNAELGIVAGYSISFLSVSERSKGAMALTAKPGMSQADADAVWRDHGDAITAMSNIAHLKIQSLPYTTVSGRSLTTRQREALGWVGDGKTTQDIAILMGLTPATVEKHLRLARNVLNVETTAQAVLKAAFQNQIFIIDR